MTAHGYVPDELKNIPFTVEQARACGLTHKQLQSASWRRISRGWYRWAGCAMSDDLRLAAVLRMVPPGSAFAGRTAARLLGIEAPAPGRPEILVPRLAGVSERVEALVSRARLAPEEIVQCGPFPVTSPLRTCFDLTGTLPLVEGVVTLDQTLHAGYFGLADFTSYVSSRDFVAGVVGARRAIEYAEPKAESPMETRLRMLLVGAGLPRPEAQVPIFDGGRFVARLDCFFASARLGIEYDGENHRDRLTEDNRRQNRLLRAGVHLLRYSGPDLRERPEQVVAEVKGALRRSSKEGDWCTNRPI